MRVSRDSSCAYHCCDQHGHSVCEPFAGHYDRLAQAARALADAHKGDPLASQVLAVLSEP